MPVQPYRCLHHRVLISNVYFSYAQLGQHIVLQSCLDMQSAVLSTSTQEAASIMKICDLIKVEVARRLFNISEGMHHIC
jgi:hypothetical protein